MYEGTRVTQDVKKTGPSSPAARYLAALLLLAFVSVPGAFGCSSNKKPSSGTSGSSGASGEANCSGADCGKPSGRFTACETSDDCDQQHGFSCVEGECSYECRSHADCIAVGHCESRSVDGERKNYCVSDATPPEPGKLYTACPNGNECADQALCVGAGSGDLDAYCTIDCTADDDCAAGYYCGSIVRAPCADACIVNGVVGEKGQPSDPRCVPTDQIGKDKAFHCGAQGIERGVCRQREFCASCESDADCLGVANQVCAKDESGEKICTRLCDTDTRSCPWGNAAQCAVFDTELGLATCSHRFGSCHGAGETCEPCRNNDDCPDGVCTSSQFTGERWCINLTTACDCPNGPSASGSCIDGGCPPSPSGLPLQCINTEDSVLFNRCYAANSATTTQLGTSPQTGCWGTE